RKPMLRPSGRESAADRRLRPANPARYGGCMHFAELIAPLTEAEFMADYWGRRPLHVTAPAGSNRAAVIDWDRLNALLQIRPHWTEAQIKLVLNSRPVNPDFYME